MGKTTSTPDKFIQLLLIISTATFFWAIAAWKFSYWGGVFSAFAILIFVLFALGSELKLKASGRFLLRMASGQIAAAVLWAVMIFASRSVGISFASASTNLTETATTTQPNTQAALFSTGLTPMQMALLSLLIPMVLFIALPAVWYALHGALPGFISPKKKPLPPENQQHQDEYPEHQSKLKLKTKPQVQPSQQTQIAKPKLSVTSSTQEPQNTKQAKRPSTKKTQARPQTASPKDQPVQKTTSETVEPKQSPTVPSSTQPATPPEPKPPMIDEDYLSPPKRSSSEIGMKDTQAPSPDLEGM